MLKKETIVAMAKTITRDEFERDILPIFIASNHTYACPDHWGLSEDDDSCIYDIDGATGCKKCWLRSLRDDIKFKNEVKNNEN